MSLAQRLSLLFLIRISGKDDPQKIFGSSFIVLSGFADHPESKMIHISSLNDPQNYEDAVGNYSC